MLYFVCSDIHGYAGLLKEALAKENFDKTNPDHTLVICGDLFDRHSENVELKEFLDTIERKVLVMGNHDWYLMNAISTGALDYADYYNGTANTIACFAFGDGAYYDWDEHGPQAIGPINIMLHEQEACQKAMGLNTWLRDNLQPYFETENYVFVHGWVPFNVRNATMKEWRTASEVDTQKILLSTEPEQLRQIIGNKTLVFGHWYTALLHFAYSGVWDHSFFFKDNVIGVDTCVPLNEQVNILVIKDNPLP